MPPAIRATTVRPVDLPLERPVQTAAGMTVRAQLRGALRILGTPGLAGAAVAGLDMALRELAGEDVELMADYNQSPGVEEAIERARALEPLRRLRRARPDRRGGGHADPARGELACRCPATRSPSSACTCSPPRRPATGSSSSIWHRCSIARL
jgi:hypothetical protein